MTAAAGDSFEPLLVIRKVPGEPALRQIRTFRALAVLVGLPSAACTAFLVTQGIVDSTLVLMALPMPFAVLILLSAARRKRALAGMQIAVSYAPLSRTVRFESHGVPTVLIPADDIAEISVHEERRAQVETMGTHGETHRHARVAFDILARTPAGDVKLSLPLIATGDSFVAAARDHLREVLREATERIIARRAARPE